MKRQGKTWFRLHAEITRNRKAQTLPAPLFKWLINLWAATCEAGGILPSAEDLAWIFRCSIESVNAALTKLREAGFIDGIDGALVPHDWNVWQFESDSSTERVKRFRERKGNVSSIVSVASGNVTETHSETETETETEQKSECVPLQIGDFDTWAELVCRRHPKPKNRTLALQALVNLATDPNFDRAAFDAVHAAWCATSAWREKNGSFAPQLAEWIHDRGYLKAPESTDPWARFEEPKPKFWTDKYEHLMPKEDGDTQ